MCVCLRAQAPSLSSMASFASFHVLAGCAGWLHRLARVSKTLVASGGFASLVVSICLI